MEHVIWRTSVQAVSNKGEEKRRRRKKKKKKKKKTKGGSIKAAATCSVSPGTMPSGFVTQARTWTKTQTRTETCKTPPPTISWFA